MNATPIPSAKPARECALPPVKRCGCACVLFALMLVAAQFLLTTDVEVWQYENTLWQAGVTEPPPLSAVLPLCVWGSIPMALFLYGPVLLVTLLLLGRFRFRGWLQGVLPPVSVLAVYIALAYGMSCLGPDSVPEEYSGRSVFLQHCGMAPEWIDAVSRWLGVLLLFALPSAVCQWYLLRGK